MPLLSLRLPNPDRPPGGPGLMSFLHFPHRGRCLSPASTSPARVRMDSQAPRVVPPSLAPDLRIEVRSKDGQQRLAVVQGSSELGFLTFRVFKSAIPESSSDPELALQSFSIHDKKAIARFYATVRRKR